MADDNKKQDSSLKLPNLLNLGQILPGQFGQAFIPLQSYAITFLTLQLSTKAINNGYFLLKQNSNDCKEEMNLVIKPNKLTRICVGAYANQAQSTTQYMGQLYLSEGNTLHTIKLIYQIQIPRIFCKKLLEDNENKCKLIRVVVNKAVTSQTHIALVNLEKYQLILQPSLLIKPTSDDPFVIKSLSKNIKAEPKQQFVVTLGLSTNICFKGDFQGIKKVVMRNVLTLSTNSILLWCLPIELIIVFVKQPQFSQE